MRFCRILFEELLYMHYSEYGVFSNDIRTKVSEFPLEILLGCIYDVVDILSAILISMDREIQYRLQ